MSEMNMVKNQELRKSFEEVTQHEMRSVLDLRKIDNYEMTDEQKEYHTLDRVQDETVKIARFLDNAEALHLTDEEKEDLILRDNRNKNLFLVNNERSGGDSDLMVNVKNAIRSYEISIKYRNQTMVEGVGFQETELEDEVESALTHAEEAIRACEKYLDRGKPFFFWRRGRYNMVKDAKARLEKEKATLEKMRDSKSDVDFADAINEGDNILSVMNKSKLEKRVEHFRIQKQKKKEEIEALKKELEEKKRIQKEKDAAAGGGARKLDALNDRVSGKAPTDDIDKKMKEREYKELEKRTKQIKKEQEERDAVLNKIKNTGLLHDMDLSPEQKREKIEKKVEKLEKEKHMTLEEKWYELLKGAAMLNMSSEEIADWKKDFFGQNYEEDKKEEEEKKEKEEKER